MDKVINIVENNICSGCGVCVSICPKGCFDIVFKENGQYYPQLKETKKNLCIDCHLCSKSCGFISDNAQDRYSDLKFNNHAGFYYSSYAAYVEDDNLRLKSASGGITTHFLKSLLDNDIVDYVVCCRKTSDTHPIISPVICKTKEDIDNCSGSFYYPIEYSEIIKQILANEGRYAIIGLPCVLRSLNNARKLNRKIKERIVFTIGLVCGSNKKASYTDFLFRKYNKNKYKNIEYINHRYKTESEQSSSFKVNINHGIILSNKVWGKYWSLGAFNLNACSYCTDVFAECADIVLMDAWKYPYVNDYKGTNFVIIRDKRINDIFNNMNLCHIEEVSIDDVVYSQKYFASPVIDKQCNNIYNKKIFSNILYKDRFDKKTISPVVWLSIQIKKKSQKLIDKKYNIKKEFDFDSLDKQLNMYLLINSIIILLLKIERKLKKIFR